MTEPFDPKNVAHLIWHPPHQNRGLPLYAERVHWPKMPFPELDEHGTPTAKLPDCPVCGDDELGVIHADLMVCYACGYRVER
jgi:ribosomal protein S27AE